MLGYGGLRCISTSEKSIPLVTGHQRTREYDGPFRYLIIDFVGPITPATPRGHRYMFTCACGWSGWYWAKPTEDDSSETAAYCLFYFVICDIAGYPTFIGSDRAKAFIEGVVKQLLEYFGITHVIGSAYHPQAQSAVERPHARPLRSEDQWDLVAPIFVWTIRTTSKIFNGDITPYEIITGLKPRTPTDILLGQPTTLQKVPKSEYLAELCRYLKDIHRFVDEHHTRVRETEQRAKFRELGPGTFLGLGDYVLVKRNVVATSVKESR